MTARQKQRTIRWIRVMLNGGDDAKMQAMSDAKLRGIARAIQANMSNSR